MKIPNIAALSFAALFACACASHVDLNSETLCASCRVGDTLSITLPSNPETGADWSVVSYSNDFLKILTRAYSPNRLSEGGDTKISFEAAKAGEAKIKLGYYKSSIGVYTETLDFSVKIAD